MTTMAEEHTGGMIALIPRVTDAEQLRVSGGEKLDELHLTLAYLGDDVTGWTADQRNNLTARALETALGTGAPVSARIMGHAVFNPDGHDGRAPCAVYLVGDSKAITPMRDMLRPIVEHQQEQHEPHIPHVTAGYGVPFSRLKYIGPVVFDRLRVAFAGDVYDFPLGEVHEKALAENFLVATLSADSFCEGKIVDAAGELTEEQIESKIMSPDPRAAKLREYWAHGKGRTQWDKWRELRRKLAKYVKNPNILDGLTSNIYRLAKGHNPPRGEKSFELTEIELKAAQALADPDAAFDLDDLADWTDEGDDEAEEFDENDPDQVYERTLIDEVNWEIDAEGALVREDEDEEDDEELPEGPGAADVSVSLWDLVPTD
jgi:hypothetical protein